jgi:endo-1,4-beta-D-glucanase Y
MIETYKIEGDGYHPFLIRDGWQVAQLNYQEEQHINNIKKLDVHLQTDEVFVLTKGVSVLIAANIEEGEPVFELELMEQHKVYNIPQDMWHNIAMEKGSEVIIIEKSNTHISDFEFFELSKEKQIELKEKVEVLMNSVNCLEKK